MLEKQLEFDFYKEMKRNEKDDKSFFRVLWNREKSVCENGLDWAIVSGIYFGGLYLLVNRLEIKDYISGLF